MEIRLTQPESVRMFAIWHAELAANAGQRHVENGTIKLDTVPSAPGAAHQMDGALVRVVYRAANRPTARAIREAAVATEVMRLPRQMYTGRLIDIKRGTDGTVFFLVRAVERRDESSNGAPAYRAFNPSKGHLIEMTINPTAETLAAGAAAEATPAVYSTPTPQAVVPAAPRTVAVRRPGRGRSGGR